MLCKELFPGYGFKESTYDAIYTQKYHYYHCLPCRQVCKSCNIFCKNSFINCNDYNSLVVNCSSAAVYLILFHVTTFFEKCRYFQAVPFTIIVGQSTISDVILTCYKKKIHSVCIHITQGVVKIQPRTYGVIDLLYFSPEFYCKIRYRVLVKRGETGDVLNN